MWESIKAADVIAAANLVLILLTLIAIGVQAWFARRSFELLLLSLRYNKHFDLSKYLLENSEMIDLSVRQETADNLKTLSDDDRKIRKHKIFMDLLMDNAEFFYISSKYANKKHNRMLVRRMMTNKEMKTHWLSPLRGSVQADFEKFVDDFYAAQDARK